MCYVNDGKRKTVQKRIDKLIKEQASNDELLAEAIRCKNDNELAITQADCAESELEKMNFGGSNALNATKRCVSEINDRIELYEEIIKDATDVQTRIGEKLTEEQAAYDAIPKDCHGTYCWECNPDMGKNMNFG